MGWRMAFRADEAAQDGYDRVRRYLISKDFDVAEKRLAEEALQDVIAKCGPPVDAYPTWHPLVPQNDQRIPRTRPRPECGYSGIDHTAFFAHGFITCPYGHNDGKEADKVIDSVMKIVIPHCAELTAERLDVPLYNEGTTPVLVRCVWEEPLEANHTVPKRLAVPLMLEQEVPCWRWAERAESWETMRPYLLGEPHGKRSSLFVTQDTALAMKKIYLAMVDSGMFGPIKTGVAR